MEIICPEAFYCPAMTDIYIKCRNHYYCPEGSSAETHCPAGTIGWGNPYNHDEVSGCTDCDPGYYSEVDDVNAIYTVDDTDACAICPAGYV